MLYPGFMKPGRIGENASEKENIGPILNSLVLDLSLSLTKGFQCIMFPMNNLITKVEHTLTVFSQKVPLTNLRMGRL